jgi:hypothetical protein
VMTVVIGRRRSNCCSDGPGKLCRAFSNTDYQLNPPLQIRGENQTLCFPSSGALDKRSHQTHDRRKLNDNFRDTKAVTAPAGKQACALADRSAACQRPLAKLIHHNALELDLINAPGGRDLIKDKFSAQLLVICAFRLLCKPSVKAETKSLNEEDPSI